MIDAQVMTSFMGGTVHDMPGSASICLPGRAELTLSQLIDPTNLRGQQHQLLHESIMDHQPDIYVPAPTETLQYSLQPRFNQYAVPTEYYDDYEVCYSEDDEMDDCDDDDDDDFDDYSDEEDPTRLLDYVQSVTDDIHRMFARNKGAEDYCDVYEERFNTVLSGRELYYSDLLALANGGDQSAKRRPRKYSSKAINARPIVTPSPPTSSSSPGETRSTERTIVYDPCSGKASTCNLPNEGRLKIEYGLGPLEELFLRVPLWKSGAIEMSDAYSRDTQALPSANSSINSLYSSEENNKPFGYNLRSIRQPQSMMMRKLPHSFWEAPGNEVIVNKIDIPIVPRTPDFADLYDQWNTEKC